MTLWLEPFVLGLLAAGLACAGRHQGVVLVGCTPQGPTVGFRAGQFTSRSHPPGANSELHRQSNALLSHWGQGDSSGLPELRDPVGNGT